jgi:hypothetical protein
LTRLMRKLSPKSPASKTDVVNSAMFAVHYVVLCCMSCIYSFNGTM